MKQRIITFTCFDERGQMIKMICHAEMVKTFCLFINDQRVYVTPTEPRINGTAIKGLEGTLSWLEEVTAALLLDYYATKDGTRAYRKPKERFS